MGFDQWFRLFLPVVAGSLARLPDKLTPLSYSKFLMTAKASRPILRNYSVRAFRADGPDGPELDVDFVLHGAAADGTAGAAAAWAQNCVEAVSRRRSRVAGRGIAFTPAPATRRVLLVAGETGLSATAGILASLAPDTEVQASGVLAPLVDTLTPGSHRAARARYRCRLVVLLSCQRCTVLARRGVRRGDGLAEGHNLVDDGNSHLGDRPRPRSPTQLGDLKKGSLAR
jgi:NADPH-dependent ferric siderophore reductase